MIYTREVVQPIEVPVPSHHEVYFGKGFRVLLKNALFPDLNKTPQKMLAIYAVRLELNCGLKNAKDIVDNLTPEHLSITAPEL